VLMLPGERHKILVAQHALIMTSECVAWGAQRVVVAYLP
jgi:hypothetical protein